MKVIIENVFSGPVRAEAVRVVESSDTERYGFWDVDVVVLADRGPYKKGESLRVSDRHVWLKHRFIGYYGTRSLWEGRPDLSALPRVWQEFRPAGSR